MTRTAPISTSSTASAAPLIPAHPTLSAVRAAAVDCRACDLWKSGAQTVFGDGQERAEVMFVGEQPGDQEDRLGKPFVGPAGQLFDRALAEAGIDRGKTYVTNTVKHFKWIAKGRRRLHQTPDPSEIAACKPWLEAEIALIQPRILVCLGATAAQTLLGKDFRVTRQRGDLIPSPLASFVLATVHPSSILRIPEEAARQAAMRRFVDDLKKITALLTDKSEQAQSGKVPHDCR